MRLEIYDPHFWLGKSNPAARRLSAPEGSFDHNRCAAHNRTELAAPTLRIPPTNHFPFQKKPQGDNRESKASNCAIPGLPRGSGAGCDCPGCRSQQLHHRWKKCGGETSLQSNHTKCLEK